MSIRLNDKLIAGNTLVTDTVVQGSTFPLSSGGAYFALEKKQDKLTAGDNIIISGNTISSTGGFSGDYEDLTNKPTQTQTVTKDSNSLITSGGVYTAVSTKIDVSSTEVVYPLIKTYVNGTSGYRIWSDGYCEQWGLTSTQNDTVTLVKTYSSTNFNVLASWGNLASASANQAGYAQCGVASVNTIYVRARYNGTSYAEKVYWRTSGYLASGQY